MTLYEILEVKETASEREIKRSYRRLVKIYHPDKSTGDSKKFSEIQSAYENLIDQRRRQEYDRRLRPEPAPSIAIILPHSRNGFRTFLDKKGIVETLQWYAPQMKGKDAEQVLMNLADSFGRMG